MKNINGRIYSMTKLEIWEVEINRGFQESLGTSILGLEEDGSRFWAGEDEL